MDKVVILEDGLDVENVESFGWLVWLNKDGGIFGSRSEIYLL